MANDRKQDIIKRLMDLGLDMSKQKNYGTSDILFGITNDTRCFSFFEEDIDNELKNRDYDYDGGNKGYCYSIHNAHKMNLLRELLIQLSKEKHIDIVKEAKKELLLELVGVDTDVDMETKVNNKLETFR